MQRGRFTYTTYPYTYDRLHSYCIALYTMSHIHPFMPTFILYIAHLYDSSIRTLTAMSHLGFSVLPRDNSTCGPEEPGNPTTDRCTSRATAVSMTRGLSRGRISLGLCEGRNITRGVRHTMDLLKDVPKFGQYRQ